MYLTCGIIDNKVFDHNKSNYNFSQQLEQVQNNSYDVGSYSLKMIYLFWWKHEAAFLF